MSSVRLSGIMAAPLERINLHYYASLRISVSASFRTPLAREALYYAEHYLNGLITQWNRIAEDLESSTSLIEGGAFGSDAARGAIFSQLSDRTDFDVHFFVLCWGQVSKFLKLFSQEQAAPDIRGIVEELSGLLGKGKDARDYFEHLEQRLAAGGGHARAKAFGGGSNLTLSYEVQVKGGELEARTDSFGREEIRQVCRAYNRVLECLGAKLERSLLGKRIDDSQGASTQEFP